eukprot:TRINITY_DN3208_c0_g1_i1.p1 TRINITY_DN3208_c0_g1~~TRINITY_DN3208_c0_g1_i1.p1  ORF type:complete len:130 (-),score=17.67 TRINITY_DN3208_c0_g1_i1:31-420(-)
MLMLCWVQLGQTYPVTQRLDEQRNPKTKELIKPADPYHGGYPGHDSHYALVRKGGGVCKEFAPVPEYLYDEVVVWQENQILPQYIVYFRVLQHEIDSDPSHDSPAGGVVTESKGPRLRSARTTAAQFIP